jgi:adenylate cyclase
LAQSLVDSVIYLWSADPAEDADRADVLASKALSADSDNAMAHLARARSLFVRKKEWDAAIAEAEAATAADRNLAAGYAAAGFYKVFSGRAAEGFAGVENALRLSPRDSLRFAWEQEICHLHAHLAQWDRAIEWCRKSIATHPQFWAYADLAAAYAWINHDVDARAAVAELVKLKPDFTIRTWANIKWSDNPTFQREYQRITDGLRKAGLAEE